MSSKTAHKKPQVHEESIERHTNSQSVNGAINDVGQDITSALWDEFLGGTAKGVLGEIMGGASNGGELHPGQEMSLKKTKKEDNSAMKQELHMEYFREVKNTDIAPHKQAEAMVDRRVEEIRMEIKGLLQQYKELQNTFKSVQVEQKVVSAGKYHETLLTFVLSLLKSARAKMSEGASWMSVLQSKKKQKQYQSMAQKHGTSFTLNNERTVATQTG